MNSKPAPQGHGAEQPEAAPVHRPRYPFSILICVWLLVFLLATIVTFMLPQSFASIARLKIEHDSDGPYFIQTEFEIIRSELVLTKVVSELNLVEGWGKKFGVNRPLTTSECINILKGRTILHLVPNTSIIEIWALSGRPDEAARIANAIADAYMEHRLQQMKVRSMAVEIVDRALPNLKAVRPNKPLNIALGIMLGGLAGFALASLVYVMHCLAHRRKSGIPMIQFSPRCRAVVHVLIALAVGFIVGYRCASPPVMSTLVVVPFSLRLGGIASAFIELANSSPTPAAVAASDRTRSNDDPR